MKLIRRWLCRCGGFEWRAVGAAAARAAHRYTTAPKPASIHTAYSAVTGCVVFAWRRAGGGGLALLASIRCLQKRACRKEFPQLAQRLTCVGMGRGARGAAGGAAADSGAAVQADAQAPPRRRALLPPSACAQRCFLMCVSWLACAGWAGGGSERVRVARCRRRQLRGHCAGAQPDGGR